MNTDLIRRFTLKARQLLTQEVQDLLEGVYGLRSDGAFEPTRNLPALLELPEAGKTRKQLECFLEDEESAGLSRRDAYAKLLKETAFTHLNRLVAFKMMEARGLRRGVLDKHQDSNEFLFYLADATHAGDYGLYQQGSFPQDALGEGPRDRAYRHFLLWLCGETAKEIKVLFDPGNLPSRLFPRPRVLQDLLALLNDPALAEAWQPGNEETIGWVYQYYNEPDLLQFRGASAPKVPAELVAAKTQQFTLHWIVEFLVQNSLGRLWLEMHPDSTLREQLGYLVPLTQASASRPMKLARELTFLDPACGTMHFGLVAFDLFHAMYLEELQRAGTPGWSKEPSVRNQEEIPGAIIAFNLHGIDIDLRAVQLSALALYLKAKAVNPKTQFIDSHLACADVLLLNGPRLESFLAEKGKGRPVFARICQALWPALRDSRQMGSLVRLEQTVREIISKERKDHETAPLFPDREHFADLYRNPLAFWESLENEILNALDQFARERGGLLGDQSLFSGEAAKGIRVLDLMLRHYDVVCTNPPYLDSHDYNPQMKAFLESHYPRTKRNLYSAFLERCGQLLDTGGFIGIITPQTFMFISSFENTRQILRDKFCIETLMHTGLNTFPDAVVDVAFYVLRNEESSKQRDQTKGTYFRLVKEPDAQAKRLAFEQAVAHVRQMTPQENEAWQEGACPADGRVFRYRQGDFDTIPGSPWVYWITPGLRKLFKDLPKLKEIAEPRVGLQTGDNFRFLRFWWEVGSKRIGFGCADGQQAQATGKRWFPYMKGGSFRRWYGNQEYTVNWAQDGAEIKCFEGDNGRIASRPQNTDFYFRRGVTWSALSSKGLSVRLMPRGFIFADKGESAFCKDPITLLGIMNSSVYSALAYFVTPTVDFHLGYLEKIPMPNEQSTRINGFVDISILLSQAICAESETTFDFIAPRWSGSLEATLQALADRQAQMAQMERQIDEEVYRLYGISYGDRRAIETELGNGALPPEAEEESEPGEEEESLSSLSTQELAYHWISYAVGIALGRFQPGVEGALGRGDFSTKTSEQLLALADADGIATLEAGHPDDLAGKVEGILEIALGEKEAHQVLAAALGRGVTQEGLRQYLARDFWKIHIQQYRKRPVYWLLQSPRKSAAYLLFHERVNRDTLPLLRGSKYLGGRIRLLRMRLQELATTTKGLEDREKRRLEKAAESLEEELADLEAFDRNLAKVLEATDERGQTVGWEPQIDDGVILNLAPLSELLPSWRAEPRKFWDELVAGKHDWSHTAMRYWPDRVLSKCKTNKSYTIAHDRPDSIGEEAER